MGGEELREVEEEVQEALEQEIPAVEEQEAVVSDLSPVEEKASKGGWVPLEQWVENGHAEDEWRSAEVFEARGELIDEIKIVKQQGRDMEARFADRLSNVNKLHEIQQKSALDDLTRQFKEAVDVADTDEALRIQGKMDELKAPAPVVAPAPVENPAIKDWRDKNRWVMDKDDPKAIHVQMKFREYQIDGLSVEESLISIDEFLADKYPPTNPNRDKAHRQEGPSKPGQRRVKAKSVSWENLTAEEQRIYKETGDDMWGSKDKFLQAVADDRSKA